MVNFSTARQLFIVLATVYMFSTYLPDYFLSGLVKILPIMVLMVMTVKFVTVQGRNLLLFGLLCSAIGDLWLSTGREQDFIFGLASFFVAHLAYIGAMRGTWSSLKTASNRWFIGAYLMVGAIIFWQFLYPGLGELLLPVLAYMLVLVSMAIATLLSQYRSYWLMLGGLSFVVSDTLIGLNKFYLTQAVDHSVVMLTYYLAQLGLVTGFWCASGQDDSSQKAS